MTFSSRIQCNDGKIIFMDKTIDRTILVRQKGHHRWLTFNNDFFQSIINLKHLAFPMLNYIPHLCFPLSKHQLEKTLICGIAGGAIIHFIQQYFPSQVLTLVEIDEVLIEIAKPYFLIETPILHQNAINYVVNSPVIDHIILDIFVDKNLPESLLQASFLRMCRAKARQTVSINLLCHSYPELISAVKTIRAQFSDQTICIIVDNHSNVICHGYSEKVQLSQQIEQALAETRINKPIWHPQLGTIVSLKKTQVYPTIKQFFTQVMPFE